MLFIKKKFGQRIIVTILLMVFFTGKGLAQLSLTNGSPSATIDFSNSMPTTVGTNTSTAFAGAGFSPNPTNATSGRLNSNAWSVVGWSDPDINYGGTGTSGDPARGVHANQAAGITTGGMYAYTGLPGSATNPALMFQALATEFTPGTLTLRLQNNGTTIITSLAISYNLFVRNDQSRGDSLNFSYSSDDFINSDYPVASMDYGSTIAPDALGWVQVGSSPSRSATLSTGVYIAPGQYFYLRWSHKDGGGSGSRDELGLDDINITATYSSPCTQPVTQATVNSFSGVLSSQLDVNFTRGNGTGGVLIVASPNAVLGANPVSGVTYNSVSNYGNGDPIGTGYVVYNGVANGTGAAATTTVTGLNPATTYYFFIFEYNITVPCYMVPGNSLSQLTAAGSATSATDYFRSRTGGPFTWNNSNSWESSPDNGVTPWITATLKPGSSAKGILIQTGHTMTITSNETAKLLTIAAGATLTYNNTASGGWDLDIFADPSDIDFKIFGTYVIFGKAATIQSGATVQVYNGGLVRVDNNVVSNTSDDFARYTTVSWATGAVFQWNTTATFQSSSATYFPNAAATDIATFRVTAVTAFAVGASSTTEIKGLLEVNANLNLANSGTKIFRNGIIGTAALTQNTGAGPILIDGATAIIGGTGVINLIASGTLTIGSASVTTMISGKTINTGAFNVDGTLLCSTYIVGGSCTFTLSAAATIGLGSTAGITSYPTAAGNIQNTSPPRSFNVAANYIYNSTVANQVTGTGLPFITTGGSLTISNTGGAGNNTVTLTTNNTTTPTLNLAAGLFEAGTGQNLVINATGTVNGTGGNQGQSAAAGTIRFIGSGTVNPGTGLALTNVHITGGVAMGGGNTTINGTFIIGASGFVNGATAPTYSSLPASTLLYSCACNYLTGNEWYANTYGTSPGVPHHVTMAGGTSINFGSYNTPHEMRGDLLINSGSTFALSTTFGGDLYIKGNWTRGATGSFTHNTRAVKFNGTSGTQTITRTGGGTETFAYLLIEKSSGQAVSLAGAPNATTVQVDGAGGSNILQMISGDLDLNQQTFKFTSYLGGSQNNLGIDGTAGNLTRNVISTGGTGTFAVSNSDAVTHFVTVNRMSGNASLLVFGPTVMVTTTGVGPGGGGINFGNTLTTVNGTLRIDSYGYVTGFAPTYGTGSYLIYNPGGTFDRNVEWGSLSGPGYPYNVTVQNSTNIRLNTPAANGDADRAIAGTLSIANGSSLLLSTTANNKLTVGANVQIDGTLTLPTVSGGDIYIGGNWNRSATGVFNPNDRAVFFNGPGNSTITASSGQLFPYLYLAKNALANTLSLLDDISISKEFAVTAGTFDPAAKNAILKSDATNGTADFGKVGAAGDVTYSGAGRFIVERYIPTGTAGGQHGKTWQFLAVPDNGGQTINAGWQEGNVLPTTGATGLGTIISSNVAGAGFDIIGGTTPALKTYNSATNTYTGVANTASLPLYDQRGYFLFVRGDRTVTAYNQTATTTTLRSTGKLFVPGSNPAPSTTVPAGKHESIGNPYASAIDFLNITKPAAPAVDDVFWVWDPLLSGARGFGGYQTISSSNGYKPNPGGTANYSNAVAYTKIQSGQAFFVHSTGGGGTVSFTENAKLSGSNLVFKNLSTNTNPQTTLPPVNNNNNNRRYFRTQLYTGAGIIADAAVVAFDNAFDNAYNADDALKMENGGENFGINSNDKLLAIEARAPIVRTDTIHYHMTNLAIQSYQLRFGPENLDINGLRAWLYDRYLQMVTPVSVSDSSYVNFDITSDPASAAQDRFIVVFKRKPRFNNHEGSIAEKGNNGKTETGNESKFNEASISIYPNPVADKMLQVTFAGNAAGRYQLQLTNNSGQVVFEQQISVAQINAIKSINVSAIPAGFYSAIIINENGKQLVQKIVIQ